MPECSEREDDGDQQPKLFSQAELNDLVRDLNLPKDSALFLASRWKEKRIPGFASYNHHERARE